MIFTNNFYKNVAFLRCTGFEDFSLFFRIEKRQCTIFVHSITEGTKREEAKFTPLPLKKAYFRLVYLPK